MEVNTREETGSLKSLKKIQMLTSAVQKKKKYIYIYIYIYQGNVTGHGEVCLGE